MRAFFCWATGVKSECRSEDMETVEEVLELLVDLCMYLCKRFPMVSEKGNGRGLEARAKM